jgi:hypothetical protein
VLIYCPLGKSIVFCSILVLHVFTMDIRICALEIARVAGYC